jgi:glycolate oxidase FAD binding subunit
MIDEVAPVSVVKPATVEQLCEEVAAADREGVAVFPWGGGTRISLGNVPHRPGIVIDTSALNRVVGHNSGDLTATFQAGATIQTVSEVLGQAGQLLAIDPPLPGRATIGGTLATGASGPTKWQFGHLRDTVIGMKVVQSDGRITKSGGQVVKNVSGYDMSRLHIGGLGSLGLILEASFKLTPVPMYESTVLARFQTVDRAIQCALDVFNSQVTPLAITGFNSSVAEAIGADERPGVFVAIRLGGRPRTLDRQVEEVTAICNRFLAIDMDQTDGPGAGRIWRLLADFGWPLVSIPALNLRISVLPGQVEQVHSLFEGLPTRRSEVAVLSQPGFGTVEAIWLDPEISADMDELAEIVKHVRERVDLLSGTVVVQQCPTALKDRVNVWGAEPSGIGIMRRLKEQYDPNNILNPGRFVGRL